MHVLNVRNVSEALARGLWYLKLNGKMRTSRNGNVIVAPGPVATVYARPIERVLLNPLRDANPFFHLYEALWMLCGRDDLAPLVKYAKNIANYSDDGKRLHGAYGHRWRRTGGERALDQLPIIIRNLRENKDDRRCVLQMWNAEYDLWTGADATKEGLGKDFPCNLTVTFQRDATGALDMVVFCRSNDIIWGAYGANAVHFSILQEFLARNIGCEVGTYTQISVNYHAYENLFEKMWPIANSVDPLNRYTNRYDQLEVCSMPHNVGDSMLIYELVSSADRGRLLSEVPSEDDWCRMVWAVLASHEAYRTFPRSGRFDAAYRVLEVSGADLDWIVAAREWFQRREAIA